MSTNVTVDLMQVLCSNVMSHVQPHTLQMNQSQRTISAHSSCQNMFLKQHSPKITIKNGSKHAGVIINGCLFCNWCVWCRFLVTLSLH